MRASRRVLTMCALLACPWHPGMTHAADKSAAQTFDSNGVKIHYSVQGKGEPVVLIHGLLSTAWINWDFPGSSALLARHFQVIALDVRAHGQSEKPTREEAYGLELVEDVVRLLDHLKIKKAHVVGYSMGGIIAAKLIARHPDRVLSGTLGGMGWLREKGAAQWAFAQMGKDGSPVGLCARSLAKLALTEAEIKAIRVPVTILVGDNDRLIKKLYVEPLQRVRTDWPVIEIPNADHISCIMRPQFKEEIQRWLAKQRKG
jgi:pimeloyl-ACP methyl ester carboxylesterase